MNQSRLILKSGNYHAYFEMDKVSIVEEEYYNQYFYGKPDVLVKIDLESQLARAARIKGTDTDNFRVVYFSAEAYNRELENEGSAPGAASQTHWHSWVEYTGLTEVYKYCSICGEKKQSDS